MRFLGGKWGKINEKQTRVEVEKEISPLRRSQKTRATSVEMTVAGWVGEKKRSVEIFGWKGPESGGRLRSSGSFASLRMTAGTYNSKNNRMTACDPTHRKVRDGWGTRGFVVDWRRKATVKATVTVTIEDRD
jgi:hypothetical protein